MVNKLLMRRHAVDSRQPSRWRVAALKDDGEIVRGSAITAPGRLGAGNLASGAGRASVVTATPTASRIQ